MSEHLPAMKEVWRVAVDDKIRICRVLSISEVQIWVIEIFGRKAVPRSVRLADFIAGVEEKKIEKVDNEPFSWLLADDESLSRATDPATRVKQVEARRAKRDTCHKLVHEVIRRCAGNVFDGAIRAVVCRSVAAEHGCHADTIERYLRAYWQGGMSLNALLFRYFLSGAPGISRIRIADLDDSAKEACAKRHAAYVGRMATHVLRRAPTYRIRIPDEVLEIREFARLHVLKPGGMSFCRGYKELVALRYSKLMVDAKAVEHRVVNPVGARPSIKQFRRCAMIGLTNEALWVKRKGRRSFLLKGRPLGGVANFGAKYPGQEYQIDSTVADVFLLDRTRRRCIGRPVLYLVVDTWSEAIVGFVVTLESASYLSAVDALYCAVRNKADLAEELGIAQFRDGMWDMAGVPKRLLADNLELRGLKANLLVKNQEIDVELARAKRPDDKPFAEVAFHGTDCRSIRWLPGSTRKTDYGDPPATLEAALTLDDFNRLILLSCIQANAREMLRFPRFEGMSSDSTVVTPNSAWIWGRRNIRGRLPSPPADLVRANILPRAKGRISKYGLEALGFQYDCASAILSEYQIAARAGKPVNVSVSYDARRIGTVWLHAPDGRLSVCEATLNARYSAYSGWSLDEVRLLERVARASNAEVRDDELSLYAQLAPVSQNIITHAKREAAKNRPTKKAKVAADKDWREARVTERRQRRGGAVVLVANDAVATPKRSRARAKAGLKASFLPLLEGF